MTLSTFPTFLTFLTFGLVCAGWLKLVTTKTDGHAIHRRAGQRAPFFGAPTPESQKGQKGAACNDAEHLSDLSGLSDTEAVFLRRLPAPPGRAGKSDPTFAALAEATEAIQSSTGAIAIYRRHYKPRSPRGDPGRFCPHGRR